jgi:hypothetical protein
MEFSEKLQSFTAFYDPKQNATLRNDTK